jgi:6-pyruvoyltetrahydropterin/6-carboxytetrahydropterin synthase
VIDLPFLEQRKYTLKKSERKRKSKVEEARPNLCVGVNGVYKVRIESGFSAAHHLANYHGKCERQHGHNYKVRVWAEGKEIGSGGMLVDFGEMKKALSEVLLDLDHSDLNENVYFGDNPSAERIARYIFERLADANPEFPLSAVDVFETDSSMARWEP